MSTTFILHHKVSQLGRSNTCTHSSQTLISHLSIHRKLSIIQMYIRTYCVYWSVPEISVCHLVHKFMPTIYRHNHYLRRHSKHTPAINRKNKRIFSKAHAYCSRTNNAIIGQCTALLSLCSIGCSMRIARQIHPQLCRITVT